jgi:pentatricopeptide repeat protein
VVGLAGQLGQSTHLHEENKQRWPRIHFKIAKATTRGSRRYCYSLYDQSPVCCCPSCTGDADAYGTIADCYTDLGEFEKAAKYYDKYIETMNRSFV